MSERFTRNFNESTNKIEFQRFFILIIIYALDFPITTDLFDMFGLSDFRCQHKKVRVEA